MRKIHKNIPVLFEPYNWRVTETKFSEATNKNNETIFTIGNGYLGVRGYFEEGFYGSPENTDPATLINGIYEYFDYHHIWQRPGFPGRYHAIVNQTNPYETSVYVDGEKVMMNANVTAYERTLNLENGMLTRQFTYLTKKNKKVQIAYKRFASQTDKHMLFGKITVKVDADADIEIKSILRPPLGTGSAKIESCSASDNIFDFLGRSREEDIKSLHYRTKRSKFTIACAIADKMNRECEEDYQDGHDFLQTKHRLHLPAGSELSIERYIAFVTDRDFADWKKTAFAKVKAARERSFADHAAETAEVWRQFWDRTDIEIDSDPLIQQGIRFSIFQIYQSTGKDGITNISANGLSGTAYSGHTFWDTEVFMMPMYLYSSPEIARSLLMYRYNILPKARERAAQMEDQGALYSWNSINGEECGHVFEAVTAQYHINNDVFYAIYRYYEATGDEEFLVNYGAEILFEISKCMAHRGNFIPLKGNKFCINVVCGPDEYNPIVDNNMYTNLLTQKQLYFTLEVAQMLSDKYPDKYQEIREKCGVDDEEMALWKRAADNMYIPYSKELDMYMQDDNFLYKDPINIENIPLEKLPLLTNLHPLNLWRYQVIKQADIVLLTFICSEYFTVEERKKIFDFYEPKTIHDSSLSASIHSIVACDIGYKNEAYGYLQQAARMDLDNVNRNTFFGLHAACMGATWMMMVNGYAGLRIYDNKLHFKPFSDEKWNFYRFKLRFRNSLLSVKVEREQTTYTLLSGESLTITHYEKKVKIDNQITLANKEW